MKEFVVEIGAAINSFSWSSLIKGSMQSGTSFALWKKPGQNNQYFLLGDGVYRFNDIPDIDNFKNGFLFFPFSITNSTPGILINPGMILKKEQGKDKQYIINPACTKPSCLDKLIEATKKIEDVDSPTPLSYSYTPDASEKDSAHFEKITQEAINEIEKGNFCKVVLSRKKIIEIQEDFDYLKLFYKLCDTYPNAFVSLVYSPLSGLWIGATPEILIKADEATFSTTALAGTQKFDDGKRLADAAWTQKEIEEQAMVSRYIINCFKKIRLREFEEIGPRTVKAGNLIHLKTDYLVDTKELNFPELPSVMLKLLHPTSAICGMPLEPSKKFIIEKENLDRAYFAGFIGPVHVENQTDIFVNLRCMNFLKTKAALYAGAGITIDSDPKKEFLETELKMNTILNVIN